MLHEDITSKIIEAFYSVYNTLGHGFLEKVYENALRQELKEQNLTVEQQQKISVYYGECKVGDYFADLLVEKKIILEIKSAETLREEHELQLLNYLKATKIEIGLLLNFGRRPEIRRKIYTNDRKKTFWLKM
jgi:GxxExxY protein